MVITIKIESQHDFQWLLPFLAALKKNTSAKVAIKSDNSVLENNWNEKLDEIFRLIEARSVTVPKIEYLTREALNEKYCF